MITSHRIANTHRNPWIIWGAGLFVYVVAVVNRSSFGVAGLVAVTWFGVSATVLSLFVVVQLGVYAAMQIPAGMALDIWGPRRLLVVGAIAMSLGQLAMALVPTVEWAIAARVLIGAGDATIFVSAVRLVWDWFPRPRVPLLTQITGVTGQLGQIVSAFPFAIALEQAGWTSAFVALAIASAAAAIVAAVFVKPPTKDTKAEVRQTYINSEKATFGEALRHPATWLGFFAHMLGGVSTTVFMLMWGFPFMIEGEHYPENISALMLTIVVVSSVVAAPIIGQFTARYPHQRSKAALIIGAAVAVGWLLILVPDNPLPAPVFGVAIVLLAIGGPASLIGLDLAATYNAPNRRSTVQGFANMGGFVSAIAVMLAVGIILDHRTGGVPPTLADYQVALSVVFLALVGATLGIIMLNNRLTPVANH